MLAFVLIQLLLLAILAVAALGAGGFVSRRLLPYHFASWEGWVAVRVTLGLVVLGTGLLALGLCSFLHRGPIALLFALGLAAAILIRDPRAPAGPRGPRMLILSVPFVPLFWLTLYPPTAFDETLYHLPTVERFARSGALPFVTNLRAPVFPHLAEVLEVPLFLFGGDVATHLLALLTTLLTLLFIVAWLKETESELAGWLGGAFFLSAPIVVTLAVTDYVEASSTLFVAASFYALGHWLRARSTGWLLAAALFAGAGANVKYFGLFFGGVVALGALLGADRGKRLRSVLIFLSVAALTLLPWYGRIVYFTGSPLFPFLPELFGHTLWDPAILPGEPLLPRLVAWVRIPWDTLLDRSRTGYQPPFSPGLMLALPLVFLHAVRHRLTRALLAVVLVWAFPWTSFPRDARYLTLVLPLASVAASVSLLAVSERVRLSSRLVRLLVIAILLPGPAYAIYRLKSSGLVPVNAATRQAWLRRHVPGYDAVFFVNERLRPGEFVYAFGAPELTYYGHERMIGELSGPARYDRLLGAGIGDVVGLDRRLSVFSVRFILLARRGPPEALMAGIDRLLSSEAARPLFRSVYSDESFVVYERRNGSSSRSGTEQLAIHFDEAPSACMPSVSES